MYCRVGDIASGAVNVAKTHILSIVRSMCVGSEMGFVLRSVGILRVASQRSGDCVFLGRQLQAGLGVAVFCVWPANNLAISDKFVVSDR